MKSLWRVALVLLVLSAFDSNATTNQSHSSFGGPIPLCTIDPSMCPPDSGNSSLQAMK